MSKMQIVGKTALVTGAGKGIGKAIAKLLAENSVAVAVNAHHAESAEAACKELTEAGQRAVAVPADVSDQGAVDRMVDEVEKQLGRIDILVNNAAAPAQIKPFVSATLADQQAELVTLLGVFNCIRRVLPGMIEAKGGRIINIGSIAGRYAMPGRAVYSAANAGIETFSRALALELGQYGVTVNCISPGAIESPRFKSRPEEIRQRHREMISLDRFGEPEEIAQAVLFLASQMANYMTGSVIDVDGGFCGYAPLKPNIE